jgi:vancomycin permeability regulator SanA
MLIIFLLISYLYITSRTYESKKWTLSKAKNNIAFVLGAAVWSENQPSPTLSSRVDRAIQLFNDGFVDKIFLTGSNAPGELAEATVALNYAVSKGMKKENFQLETFTGSTNDQILFLKTNLVDDKEINDIIIVSDSYHLPRVIEICRFYNVDIKVTASNHPLSFNDKLLNNLRESVAMFSFLCFAL